MQDIAALKLTPAKLASIDAALAALEAEFAPVLLDMSPSDIAGLAKMGDGNEPFCRLTVNVMTLNPGIVPPSYDLDAVQSDLADLDALRVRMLRIQQLREKCSDTAICIGSDIMVAALEGYALVKIAGLGAGLDEVRRQMGARFAKKAKAKKTDGPATPPASTPTT